MIEINGDHYLLMSIGEWEDLGELGYQFNCVIKKSNKEFYCKFNVRVCMCSKQVNTLSYSLHFPIHLHFLYYRSSLLPSTAEYFIGSRNLLCVWLKVILILDLHEHKKTVSYDLKDHVFLHIKLQKYTDFIREPDKQPIYSVV